MSPAFLADRGNDETSAAISNEGNRGSIPSRPPHTSGASAADKTHRRLLPYRSSHAMPEFSEVEQTAPKLTITVWALVTPHTQRRF
jgi:hypothetical protein